MIAARVYSFWFTNVHELTGSDLSEDNKPKEENKNPN